MSGFFAWAARRAWLPPSTSACEAFVQFSVSRARSAMAVKCYYSQPFWVKMSALSLAVLFTFTVRRRLVTADEVPASPVRGRLVAFASIALWGAVAWGGRWIGFSG
jgi:hypothetical protein